VHHHPAMSYSWLHVVWSGLQLLTRLLCPCLRVLSLSPAVWLKSVGVSWVGRWATPCALRTGPAAAHASSI
jgi:hypothetical protein